MNNTPNRKQILLTNDDGIESPGLWAAAEALSTLGFVTVAAPRDQASGTGRSLPVTSDGRISRGLLTIKGQEWEVFSVGGTPGQAVQHAVLEIQPERHFDLVVSGINYGENLGTGITVSGTVGAAMEAAAMGIPALATSLQLLDDGYYSYSREVDFSTAAHFTCLFAKFMLENPLPDDVDLLKLDVPNSATPATPWRVTRLARHRYFVPFAVRQGSWDEPGKIAARAEVQRDEVEEDSDVRAVTFDHIVSITPISLDMTSRVKMTAMERLLRGGLK